MSMCDKFENWNMYTEANKLDALKEAAARMAEDYGVAAPDVVSGVPNFPHTPEDDSQKAGAYDPESNTVYINENLVNDPNPQESLHELGHEFAHELYNNDWYDEDNPEGSSEDFAKAYADDLADEIKDKCDPKPPQSPGVSDDDDSDNDEDEDEEGGGGDSGRTQQGSKPGDWNLPSGDTLNA